MNVILRKIFLLFLVLIYLRNQWEKNFYYINKNISKKLISFQYFIKFYIKYYIFLILI